eukprot:GSMAST32.ASY1.ANO1.548.1 assembled CDS
MSMKKSSKMLHYINYRMKITLRDSRELVGTFMAFDKNLNIVLGDCEERRQRRSGNNDDVRVERRSLGMILLRGDCVVSLNVEGPPPSTGRKKRVARVGTGIGVAAGRGKVISSSGAAPPQGLRGPMAAMAPQGMMPRGMPHPGMMGAPPPGMMPPRGMMGHPPMGAPPPRPMSYGGPPPNPFNLGFGRGPPPPFGRGRGL